jgi:hypothetical protein
VSSSNEFAEILEADYSDKNYGVESIGMNTKLGDLIVKGDLEIDKMDDHTINQLRSKHFIKTLFELRTQLNSNGNLILNCGATHNNHITEWIENGNIDNITDVPSSYVRINTL